MFLTVPDLPSYGLVLSLSTLNQCGSCPEKDTAVTGVMLDDHATFTGVVRDCGHWEALGVDDDAAVFAHERAASDR